MQIGLPHCLGALPAFDVGSNELTLDATLPHEHLPYHPFRVGEVGEPFELGGNVGEVAELGGGERAPERRPPVFPTLIRSFFMTLPCRCS
jgi:hypothetical protein